MPPARSVTFTVYGEARPGGSKRAFMVKGRPVITDDAGKTGKAWRRDVQLAAVDALGLERWNPATVATLAGPLAVRMTFYRRRPRSHYGARGLLASAPPYPTTKPDVLKLARAAEDALTGLLWSDDAQIVAELLGKAFGEPERLEISVSEVV